MYPSTKTVNGKYRVGALKISELKDRRLFFQILLRILAIGQHTLAAANVKDPSMEVGEETENADTSAPASRRSSKRASQQQSAAKA